MKELKIVKELLVCCCLVSILWTSCQQRDETRDVLDGVRTLRHLATETDKDRCRRYLAVQKTNEAVDALARQLIKQDELASQFIKYRQENEEGQQDGTGKRFDADR